MKQYIFSRSDMKNMFAHLNDDELKQLRENEKQCYRNVDKFYEKVENFDNTKTPQQEKIRKQIEKDIELVNTSCIESMKTFTKDVVEYPKNKILDERKNVKAFAIKTIDYQNNVNEIKETLHRFPEIKEDTLRAKTYEIDKLMSQKFRLFNTLKRKVDKIHGDKFIVYYYSEPSNDIAEKLALFCTINNLCFTPEQLTEIIYLYNTHIIFNRENIHHLYNYIGRTTTMQEYDNICLFFEMIVKKEYDKNPESYDSIEDCFVFMARFFNTSKTLYMTYDKKMEFFANFELNTDTPLEIYCQIKHNSNFADEVRDNIFGILEPLQYIESVSSLKEKINNLQDVKIPLPKHDSIIYNENK